jgi:hypothetical protein
MGVKFITAEKKDPVDMQRVIRHVFDNIKKEQDALIEKEVYNDEFFKELYRDRLNWEKASKGDIGRRVALIPHAIHLRAEQMFGKEYLRDDKLFKKFLDTEIVPGVKGEVCLTIPRNRL